MMLLCTDSLLVKVLPVAVRRWIIYRLERGCCSNCWAGRYCGLLNCWRWTNKSSVGAILTVGAVVGVADGHGFTVGIAVGDICATVGAAVGTEVGAVVGVGVGVGAGCC